MTVGQAPQPFGRRVALIVASAAALALCMAGSATASSFTVNPTQVALSGAVPSRTVTVRNDSDRSLRFQVTVFKWDQDSRGQMQLSATQDIIFFPSMLTLAPREERRVRVGLSTGFTGTEKTYRLFVEELPQPEGSDAAQQGGVTVLTKMGIPIFLQPAQPLARATVGNLTLAHGTFRFVVANVGNVHFIAGGLRMRGVDRAGAVVFERTLAGWYILAGGTQSYQVAIPSADCARLAALDAEVRIGPALLSEHLQLPQPSCGP